MAIEQTNVYSTNQNITNLAINVDYDRLEIDQSIIEVNFGTTPATVTVKVGSLIEVNGNRYRIITADETFQMSNATHNYITFDGTTFGSAATAGIFDPQKQGYYQASNTDRTLKWYIDQVIEDVSLNMDFIHKSNRFKTLVLDHMDHCRALGNNPSFPFGAAAIIQLTTVSHDTKGLFNNSTYTYTIRDAGYYIITGSALVTSDTLNNQFSLTVRKNGASQLSSIVTFNNTSLVHSTITTSTLLLNAGDLITLYGQASIAGTITLVLGTLTLDRLF